MQKYTILLHIYVQGKIIKKPRQYSATIKKILDTQQRT